MPDDSACTALQSPARSQPWHACKHTSRLLKRCPSGATSLSDFVLATQVMPQCKTLAVGEVAVLGLCCCHPHTTGRFGTGKWGEGRGQSGPTPVWLAGPRCGGHSRVTAAAGAAAEAGAQNVVFRSAGESVAPGGCAEACVSGLMWPYPMWSEGCV